MLRRFLGTSTAPAPLTALPQVVFTCSHEHRRPPLTSLVAHLLKVAVRFIQTFIAQGPPSQAVLLCPVWRFLGQFRKRSK
jgi:hypothetical protein